ncbi:MAG: GNAT family N-acetyltransferase [Ilumatobacter sp.]|nr:GNAT family N-acetyltransferase [Ilumatobacter sp.]
MSASDLTVTDDAESLRFTLRLNGEIVGHADYSLDDSVVTIPHVETLQPYRGRGFAAVLMNGVIESLRNNGHTIRPTCSYAAEYLRERPDTHDLVAH